MTQLSAAEVGPPLISIVVPALNEAANVPGLVERYRDLLRAHPDCKFELVLVDDGSTDGTADLLMRSVSDADHVTAIRLSRSFGSHYAISAGLAECHGDAAIVLGADLQEPPELISDFISNWETGSDVVWGVRRSRVGRSRLDELASTTFSWLFTRFANLANYPPEGPSGVLIDRIVVDEVVRLPERNRNTLALIAWLGFDQTQVYYDQQERVHGASRWTKRKMIKLALDSLIQFSSTPLRVCSAAGLILAGLGALYALILVVRSLMGVNTPAGWPTVLVVVLIVGGTQLAMIGIMGEYLWRGVEESRNRPLYVVRDILHSDPQDRGSPVPTHGRRRSSATRFPIQTTRPAEEETPT